MWSKYDTGDIIGVFIAGLLIGFMVTMTLVVELGTPYQVAYRDYRAGKIEEKVKKWYPELWIEYNVSDIEAGKQNGSNTIPNR